MRYAITGGAGFIGANLVRSIVQAGDEAVVIDNFVGGKRVERLTPEALYVDADITDRSYDWRHIDKCNVMIHLAALPRVQYSIAHPVETLHANVIGTACALEAARVHSIRRFIYAASSSAYGDYGGTALREDMPTQPQSPYGLQKLVGEDLCRMWNRLHGLETVSLRFFNVYGPYLDPYGDYALVIGKFLTQSRNEGLLTITGDGEQTRDFTHVSDVVRAILLAVRSPNVGSGEVINIGAGRNVSINRLAALFSPCCVVYVPARQEPRHTLADVSKAEELLGWRPQVLLEEGIQDLLQRNCW